MHRSGTSLLTRSLRALGVYLGDNFVEDKPDNPTGYWEDRFIVDLNERLFQILGLEWKSGSLVAEERWNLPEVVALRDEAADYLAKHFAPHPLWGFKDPRTIRLLPFWRAVFAQGDRDDNYILIIRNPLSVAGSLEQREKMAAVQAHLVWLAHLLPYLHLLSGRPRVVVDYDLLMLEPHRQLHRIANRLQIEISEEINEAIDLFAADFLDEKLRHNLFSPDDYGDLPQVGALSREAYRWLRLLATDRLEPDSPRFWPNWNEIKFSAENTLREFSDYDMNRDEKGHPRCKTRLSFPDHETKLFVVIGFQRTGTEILSEILNSHPEISAFQEILLPSYEPTFVVGGHLVSKGIFPLDNFLRENGCPKLPLVSSIEAESLLDRYFEYLCARVRESSHTETKRQAHLVGVNIKYSQLMDNNPGLWDSNAPPFLLCYLKSRGVQLIHTTRKNVLHCAISHLIAEQRGVWHDYEGASLDKTYFIDIGRCLEICRRIMRERESFLKFAPQFEFVPCCYEDLCLDLARSVPDKSIPAAPGPLSDIAQALHVSPDFRYEGNLRKAIRVTYSKLISNWGDLVADINRSEFASLASTLN